MCFLSSNITGFYPVMSPRFSVRSMLATKTTILLKLKSIRGTALILRGCVVTASALIARQDHHLPHSVFLSSRAHSGPPASCDARAGSPLFSASTTGMVSPNYVRISLTTPAPTVRPPSRIANRNSFSNAIGVINSTCTATLSPGITISVPAGNVTTPVTSVVRK